MCDEGKNKRKGGDEKRLTEEGFPSQRGPSPDMTARTSNIFTSRQPMPSIKPTARGVLMLKLRRTIVPPAL